MPAPDGVPVWMWRLALWVVGGIMAITSTVLGWVGKKYVAHRADQIEDLRQEIEDIRQEMGEDHAGVEDQVARLDDKMDKVLDEVAS